MIYKKKKRVSRRINIYQSFFFSVLGRYRGPAHGECNLAYQDSRIIPVVFHNLSKYDGHFLIKEVSKGFSGNIRVLPLTKENYISFTVYTEDNFARGVDKKHKRILQFRFIDSLRFLNSSLDKLSSFLTTFPEVEKYFPNLSQDKFQLLLRKGVFPYEWMDSTEKIYSVE